MNVDMRLGHSAASVIFERFGEEVVAIHLGTGRYYSLPGVAGDAFLMLAKTPTVSELAEALSAQYDAPAQLIESDLIGFLGQLKDESLIVEERHATEHSLEPLTGPRVPYSAPAVHAHRDLENLFLVDPIHEAGEAGWPQVKKPVEPLGGDLMRYRFAAERCLFEQFEEATIALNLNTGAYFSFSGTAEDILLLVNEGPTAEEIARALETKYDAAGALLREAVERFLGRLVQTDLVIAEAIEEGAESRTLTLAKPGEGMRFHPPELEMYRDAPAADLVGKDAEAASSLLSKKKQFRLNRDENLLAFARDGAIAVHLIRGVYFVLNSTASRVLEMLENEPTASEIVSALESLYEVRRPELVAAVIVLLQNFIGIGVATAEAASDARVDVSTLTGDKASRIPFETFSVDMRHDLREQLFLYPGGRPTPPEPVSRGRQLSTVLEEYFDEAAQRAPVSETKLLVAGRRLRIRCIDEIHSRHLSLALAHLRHDFSGDGDFTISVWDGEVAGAPSNSLLASYLQTLYRDWTGNCGTRGELRGFHSAAVPAFYMPGPDVLNLVDAANGKAFFLKRDSTPLPYWEAGSPFRAILHCWLSTFGLQFVHGGAVGEGGSGVLLAARGGSGKTTTTLLCLNAGMNYAGDDYCAVDPQSPMHLHSLYNTAKLLPRDLDHFPSMRQRVWNPQALVENSPDKATFFLADLAPERMSSGFALSALLIPQVTEGVDSYLTPCGPAAVLAAIAPSTVAQLPNATQADMERMVSIASNLPSYVLHLGSDRSQIPEVVRSVLRRG